MESALLRNNQGLIFFFNPDKVEQVADFALNPESTGFKGTKPVRISQEYPSNDNCKSAQPGATVPCLVPAESAIVLRVGAACFDRVNTKQVGRQ